MKQSYLFGIVGILLGLVVGVFLIGGYNYCSNENYVLNVESNALGEVEGVAQFDSYESFINFLKVRGSSSNGDDSRSFSNPVLAMDMEESFAPTASGMQKTDSAGDGGGVSYSETNVQVEDVDEPDIVKTDGKYIYAVSNNAVAITEAYPASEMKILGKIDFSRNDLVRSDVPYDIEEKGYESQNVRDIFVGDDVLVILVDSYVYEPYSSVRCLGQDYCGGDSESYSDVLVYDVSDKLEPKLVHEVRSDGYYIDARMIGDFVYYVSNKYVDRENPILPVYYIDGVRSELSIDDLYYFGDSDDSYVFSSVAAINVVSGEVNREAYLVGATSQIYASEDNIFLTYSKYRNYYDYEEDLIRDVVIPLLPGSVADEVGGILDDSDYKYNKFNEVGRIVDGYYRSLPDDEMMDFNRTLLEDIYEYKKETEKDRVKTIIQRISISEGDVSHEASGEVSGSILNQYSMDESDGNFRIATTSGGWWWWGSRTNSTSNVYVLNSDLEVIGELEGLASGETIYSSRFMGDRLYLVTYRRVDPFFVIDLSSPTRPEVLGYLKITGVSNYLHPYDEDHIIGIGNDGDDDVRTGGLKISLYDVSDVNNPRETAKYVVGERGSYSEVQNDPHALLFDKSLNLMVLPVRVTTGDYSNYWVGAYVFDIDSDDISLRGKVSHSSQDNSKYWYDSQYSIRRSLYIDDVLYTVSTGKIKANDLTSLDFLNEVVLYKSVEVDEPVYYKVGGRVAVDEMPGIDG